MIESFLHNIKSILNNFYKRDVPDTNDFILKRSNVKTGNNLVINGLIHINNAGGEIFIGDDVVINSGTDYNSAGGEGATYISVLNGAVLKIGNKVGMSNVVIDVWDKIIIEDKVAIGACSIIRDNDAHSLNLEDRFDPLLNKKNTKHAPILIKRGAFIGMRSIILKGVTVGAESVVGAGSVVTRDVPDREIWAGNPARFIRKI